MPTKTPTKNSQLDRIELAVIGKNGEGLLVRTARIEEKLNAVSTNAEVARMKAEEAVKVSTTTSEVVIDRTDRTIAKTGEMLQRLTISVVELTASVNTHHKTEHFSDLLKKKTFYITIFLGFIIMYTIATYVPNIWDGTMILLGIPKFILPIAP